MRIVIYFFSIFFIYNIFALDALSQQDSDFYVPVDFDNRQSLNELQITEIGKFGELRKERKGIPSHLHTGLDIKRPNSNYFDEPIFTVYKGIVISIRDDGPYAQVIIEHKINDSTYIWSVYEHLSGIKVELNETVDPLTPIGRFMNKEELNKYGWQFDHIHLEIMKEEPRFRKPTNETPNCFFKTYWQECLTNEILDKYYYNPEIFLNDSI